MKSRLLTICFNILLINVLTNICYTQQINDNISLKTSFSNSFNITDTNKIWFKSYELPKNSSITSVEIRPKEENTSNNINENIDLKSDYVVNFHEGIEEKRTKVIVWVKPFKKNKGTITTLKSFSLDINYKINTQPNSFKRNIFRSGKYTTTSALNSGSWYRFNISKTGVYKLTFDWLSQNNAIESNTPTNQINIYGLNGGMLPEKNNEIIHDDLPSIPSEIIDANSNGIFDSGDAILFYGVGPDKWYVDDTTFYMKKNIYSDHTSYFIGYNSGLPPNRLTNYVQPASSANYIVNNFNSFIRHESEEYNFIKSGRTWYGNKFDVSTDQSFNFSFPNRDQTEKIHIEYKLMARSVGGSSSFDVFINNNFDKKINLAAVTNNYNGPYGSENYSVTSTIVSGSTITSGLRFNRFSPDAVGFIDFIQVNARVKPKITGNQFSFRDTRSIGLGNISEFSLEDFNSNYDVWDVTNIHNTLKVIPNVIGSIASFKAETDSLKEFITFNRNNLYTPSSISKVNNQNLHGITQKDMVIVCHPNFISSAQRLSNHHTNNGINNIIVTPEQIYNEFSAGNKDITAIKLFMKMLYDRATLPENLPKYLLLFGDGSYDMRDILVKNGVITSNTDFIPSFQSTNSLHPTLSYITDDYFGLLDDNESNLTSDFVDVAIGRFPVQTIDEANAVVDKIINYDSHIDTRNNWRNVVSFVSDDEDNNKHIDDSEKLSTLINNSYPVYNIDKIYADAYQQTSTAGGARFPEMETTLKNRVQRGSLIVNYTGHGGELGWGHERYLDVLTIQGWSNKNALPLFVTATCEFSRFDDPERTSAGEHVILNKDGGGIGLLTTTRVVYSNGNFDLNSAFYNYAFEYTNNRPSTIGEILKATKNNTPPSINKRNFTLLGDPALQLGIAKYKAKTTLVNNKPIGYDTIKALSTITIKGELQDLSDNKLSSFNGVIYITVFDKPSNYQTLKNDLTSSVKNFEVQNNKIYSGKVEVKNGEFSYQFIVPKDINYTFGNGKISYYSNDGIIDAKGFDTTITVGGENDTIINDNKGPEIELFINNESFISGGLTGHSPIFIAKLSDENGINTTGAGIGHDLTAILNNDETNPIMLNDYYEADLNTYKSGRVEYPFSNLENGEYTLTFKAWDALNNSSEETIKFIVSNSDNFAIDHVLNYPNPFTTNTDFYFDVNQTNQVLNVQIQIFTITGRIVKNISQEMYVDGFRSQPINWKGTDDFGDQLAKGVYLYKLVVENEKGEKLNKTEKLVILK